MSIGSGIAILGIWGSVAAIVIFSSVGATVGMMGFCALIATIAIAICD